MKIVNIKLAFLSSLFVSYSHYHTFFVEYSVYLSLSWARKQSHLNDLSLCFDYCNNLVVDQIEPALRRYLSKGWHKVAKNQLKNNWNLPIQCVATNLFSNWSRHMVEEWRPHFNFRRWSKAPWPMHVVYGAFSMMTCKAHTQWLSSHMRVHGVFFGKMFWR